METKFIDDIVGAGKDVTFERDIQTGKYKLTVYDIDISHLVDTGKFRPIRVADRLYELDYEDYDYIFGAKYLERYKATPAGCSVLRKGNLVGGNYDWYYGDEVEIVLTTKAVNGRHATLGVVHSFGDLTKEFITSGRYSDIYEILPFMTSDLVNDCGVYAKVNVVWPGDKGFTTGTLEGAEDLPQLMIPRYVCDYASTAAEAIDLLSKRNIYAPLNGIHQELHFLIADQNETYVVEFVNNEMVVFEAPLMTNFYLDGWNGEIKTAYLGNTDEEIAATGLTEHAMGLERYDILSQAYEAIETETDVLDALKSVKYTDSYDLTKDPKWYSEFFTSGDGEWGKLTIYSKASDFDAIMGHFAEEFSHRERNRITWCTNHTAIYDLENRKLTLYIEEDFDHKFEWKLHIPGTIN